ncbi:hypothetical protein [Paragemmobacter straminiformis]|uniref:Uncharacterized protein n=1 Tax=Paragemmobacter straminiformis TaxID=2045119 RepID=A0A842I3Y3_9RHOB|nr:hypothetical protein [Gemmobacter straminiformis]MBC2834143.1 hypothetical protein [Gemmobacter straminiformis]
MALLLVPPPALAPDALPPPAVVADVPVPEAEADDAVPPDVVLAEDEPPPALAEDELPVFVPGGVEGDGGVEGVGRVDGEGGVCGSTAPIPATCGATKGAHFIAAGREYFSSRIKPCSSAQQ